MKKREYPLSMNFVINQPHSVNNGMFVWWDEAYAL